MSEQNDTAQVIADLKAARAELVKRGRSKGRAIREDGSACILGALGLAAVEGYEQLPAERRQMIRLYEPRVAVAYDVLQEHMPGDEKVLYLYNDHPNTTDADVLNLFDKALAELGGLA